MFMCVISLMPTKDNVIRKSILANEKTKRNTNI